MSQGGDSATVDRFGQEGEIHEERSRASGEEGEGAGKA